MKALKIIFIVLSTYALLEFWARVRFDLQNQTMPMDIRANMAMSSYDAYKLKKNYRGRSRTGIAYHTDSFGFRIGDKANSSKYSILLGGDSRVFGAGLSYKDTLSGLIEEKSHFKVFQQALPGGSPAFFNRQIFDQDTWDKLEPKPSTLVYTFDRDDVKNDREFLQDVQKSHSTLRRLKLYFGGYFWNMLNVKVKGFLFKKKSKPTVEHKPKRLLSLGPCEPQLERMIEEAAKRKVRIILVYLPRLDELKREDTHNRDLFAHFCQQHDVIFLDAYDPINKASLVLQKPLDSFFIDPEEGIHFNAQGYQFFYKTLAPYLNEDTPTR